MIRGPTGVHPFRQCSVAVVGASLGVLSQIFLADMRDPGIRLGLSSQRIELPRRAYFACRPQLAFPNHVHEFDTGKRYGG
jgi:hypothetical protein